MRMPKTDQRRGDEGFTVVEVMITLLLLGIVSATLLAFLDSTLRATTRASKNVQSEQAMTLALRSMTQEIRSADKLTKCATASYATCLVIEVPRQVTLGLACPSRKITYQVTGGFIRETRVVYPANACTPTQTVFNNRPLLESVVNTNAQPLFTYFDPTGAIFNPDLLAADVAAAAVSDAGSIKAEVFVDYGAVNSPVISLSSMAALRNQR